MDFFELVKDFGALAAVALMAAAWFYDRSKSETKRDSAFTEIALDSTEQAFKKADQAIEQGNQLVELFRQLGDVRQDLGRAEGQNIVLTRNFEASEAKREEMRNKILELDNTIIRHERRIVELESEAKRKDKAIADLEAEKQSLEKTIAEQTVQIVSLSEQLAKLDPPVAMTSQPENVVATPPETSESPKEAS